MINVKNQQSYRALRGLAVMGLTNDF